MYRTRTVLCLALTLVWGCASTPPGRMSRASRQGLDTNPPPAIAVSDLRAAVDSAMALYDFGDMADVLALRDSLARTIESAITNDPTMANDVDFIQIRRDFAYLDSLLTGPAVPPGYLSEVDSLALSLQSWPDDTTGTEVGEEVTEDTLFVGIENDRVDFWLRYFTGPGKERFARSLYRMELYRPVVEGILAELELPKELICVALIESGFTLTARSRAKAVGPWQFISGTARIYGLRVNWWYDERRDIVASTYAAGNYLKDLYGIWNSWPLALAAYNCGEYRVARAVAVHKTTDFWKLRLPKQTERYVPKFLAALYIFRDPEHYGFTLPDVEPVKFDEVKIKDATDLKLIAQSANSTVDVVRELNPHLLQWATPPGMEVTVRVPEGAGETCQNALDSIPAEQRVTWRKHRIKTGETLSVIAAHYGTSVSALMRLNSIRNAHKIRAGHYLIVPVQGGFGEVASSTPQYMNKRRTLNKEALEKYAKKYAPPANHKRTIYVVKDRDTLGEIAELYHTRAQRIREWNNLSYRSYIYPGQKLVIYVPESFDLAMTETPTPPTNPTEYVVRSYTVRKGDTFYAISRRFNVKVVDLLTWNGKSSRSVIYPGQTLQIWERRTSDAAASEATN